MSEKKQVDEELFRELYLSGAKMSYIRKRMGDVSRTFLKDLRRRLDLPRRPAWRTPTREKLPDRRRSWTQTVQIRDPDGRLIRFYLSFGEYEDGRLGEIWLEAAKQGTFLRGALGAMAMQVSLALQCGVPLSEITKIWRGVSFPPNGEVLSDGLSQVKDCSSVVDWAAQEIDLAYNRRRRE